MRQLTGDVQFEHVKFGYNPDKIIINDFSADVKDGQKIAIVGPTGAGKTTMVKLLMRFYDLNGGTIKVDGYDIKDFQQKQSERDVWNGASGYLAVLRNHYGKYPLRTSGCYR